MDALTLTCGDRRGAGERKQSLDTALAELGMLVAVTDHAGESRECLRETLSSRDSTKGCVVNGGVDDDEHGNSIHRLSQRHLTCYGQEQQQHQHLYSPAHHFHRIHRLHHPPHYASQHLHSDTSGHQLNATSWDHEKLLRMWICTDENRRNLWRGAQRAGSVTSDPQQSDQQQQQQQQARRLAAISLGVSAVDWDAERTVPLISLSRSNGKDLCHRLHRSASTSRARHLFMPYEHPRSGHHNQLLPRSLFPLCNAHSTTVRHLHERLQQQQQQQQQQQSSCSARDRLQLPSLVTFQLPAASSSVHNKSNPPSPVKNGSSSSLLCGIAKGGATCGAPLVRSKSLDNIALCPLVSAMDEHLQNEQQLQLQLQQQQQQQQQLNEIAAASLMARVDSIVESVSSRIGSLQLTAN